MRVPWKRVNSWHCSACGKCCMQYKVRLNFYEYLILKHTGYIEEKAGKYYIKKIGKKCPFQIGRLCSLHGKNKPLACRIYPFVILRKGEEEAYYEYMNEALYVYVETACPNIKLGKYNEKMEKMIKEAVEIYFGLRKYFSSTA